MMAWGSAVQVKGFGLSLVSARYRLIAAWRSTMSLKMPLFLIQPDSHTREPAGIIRQRYPLAATYLRYDVRRRDQLLALAAGFERFADRLQQELAAAD